MAGTFRSLHNRHFRHYTLTGLPSNIGTWMQRTAQDWLVLTELTQHSATALGIVTALQFLPPLLLLPFTGLAADRMDRRKLLMLTQGSMALLAMLLGLLVVTGSVALWHAYLFAFLLGCCTAFDSPVRQSFVAEMVGEARLSNAVALNSMSFNSARMIGPAAAGVLIAAVGTGWIFIVNGLSFLPLLLILANMPAKELHRSHHHGQRQTLWAAFPYVWHNKVLLSTVLMVAVMGSVGLNLPIYIATMSTLVFHGGASQYGLMTSMLALGTISGAVLAARREAPTLGLLLVASSSFALAMLSAAVSPTLLLFCLILMLIGLAAQTFLITANSRVQLATAPHMRGRVMALFMAVAMGGQPLTGPLVGWVVDHFGARWGLLVGAMGGVGAALIAGYYGWRQRR